jgi:hypothetical protein
MDKVLTSSPPHGSEGLPVYANLIFFYLTHFNCKFPQNIGTTAYLRMLQTRKSSISIDSSCQLTFQDLHHPNYLHICFCHFHYWMNADFVGKMINHVDQRLMCFVVPLGTGMRMRMMRMLIPSKSEKLWMLLKISVHFLRVCWRPKNLVMQVVQLHVVGICIREDLVCLQEASPLYALLWRGIIRWTFYWYCRHSISWQLLSSGLWHVLSGRRVLMYQRFLIN